MAHHKSAKTRIRRNERKRISNKTYMSNVRTAVKKFRTAVTALEAGEGAKEAVRPLFVEAQSLLGKAGRKGLIHVNNAARKISRLSHTMKSVDTGTIKTEAPKKITKKKVVKKKTSKKK